MERIILGQYNTSTSSSSSDDTGVTILGERLANFIPHRWAVVDNNCYQDITIIRCDPVGSVVTASILAVCLLIGAIFRYRHSLADSCRSGQ